MKNKIKIALVMCLITALASSAMAQARKVHRASQVGGTGMMLMRIGDQLDPNELNASIFVEYMAWDKLPLNPDRIAHAPYIDDPRGDGEFWTTLTVNYGINHIVELGLQIPLVFNSDLKEDGIGRIGFDARLLVLNPDRMGLGISATFWGSAISFQEDNSSNEFNGGGELNFMGLGSSATNYLGLEWFDRYLLEPMRLYATIGWGYEDYIEFGLFHDFPSARNPLDINIVGTEVIYGNIGLEYEVYDQLFIGTELSARQWPDYHNDNNFILILPEISYTYKDIFTIQAAFGFTELGNTHNHQPDWLAKIGFTYHFPELVKPVKPRPEGAPPVQQDLIDLFTPSRKPVPTETPTQETPFTPQGGAEGEGEIEVEPVQ